MSATAQSAQFSALMLRTSVFWASAGVYHFMRAGVAIYSCRFTDISHILFLAHAYAHTLIHIHTHTHAHTHTYTHTYTHMHTHT